MVLEKLMTCLLDNSGRLYMEQCSSHRHNKILRDITKVNLNLEDNNDQLDMSQLHHFLLDNRRLGHTMMDRSDQIHIQNLLDILDMLKRLLHQPHSKTYLLDMTLWWKIEILQHNNYQQDMAMV